MTCTVDILLQKGMDVDAQGGKYGNARWALSAGSHQQIVHLLSQKITAC